MEIKHSISPFELKTLTTEQIRDRILIKTVFAPDEADPVPVTLRPSTGALHLVPVTPAPACSRHLGRSRCGSPRPWRAGAGC